MLLCCGRGYFGTFIYFMKIPHTWKYNMFFFSGWNALNPLAREIWYIYSDSPVLYQPPPDFFGKCHSSRKSQAVEHTTEMMRSMEVPVDPMERSHSACATACDSHDHGSCFSIVNGCQMAVASMNCRSLPRYCKDVLVIGYIYIYILKCDISRFHMVCLGWWVFSSFGTQPQTSFHLKKDVAWLFFNALSTTAIP